MTVTLHNSAGSLAAKNSATINLLNILKIPFNLSCSEGAATWFQQTEI